MGLAAIWSNKINQVLNDFPKINMSSSCTILTSFGPEMCEIKRHYEKDLVVY